MEALYLVLLSVFSLLAIVYGLLRRQQNLLRKLGIPVAANPHLIFGNVEGISRTAHRSTIFRRIYSEFKQRGVQFGGFMNFFRPSILLLHPELIKDVLVGDFDVFRDRGLFVDTKNDPISGGLFALEGAHWKNMRQKLTPTFTSGRMKAMFETMVDVADRMREFVWVNAEHQDLDMKVVFQRFTTDVIGNVAFGIECNAMNDPNSEFCVMGRKAFRFDWVQMLKFFVAGQYKTLVRLLGIKLMPEDVNRFFIKLTKDTVEYREKNGVRRNDFLSLLMDIRGEGVGELSLGEMAAQCFIFFSAGFETSTATMSFCLFELAKNADIQDKLRAEIDRGFVKDQGKLTYETILGLDLLDRVVKETLRKYSPVDALFRMSSTPFTIPGTRHTIPASTIFQVPVDAIHHDPEYYPEPERFDPDRFLPEQVKVRPPFTYLPFGDGPRNCIGLRFGLLQVKIGLAVLLRNFRFGPSARTARRIELDPGAFIATAKGGMFYEVECLSK